MVKDFGTKHIPCNIERDVVTLRDEQKVKKLVENHWKKPCDGTNFHRIKKL